MARHKLEEALEIIKKEHLTNVFINLNIYINELDHIKDYLIIPAERQALESREELTGDLSYLKENLIFRDDRKDIRDYNLNLYLKMFCFVYRQLIDEFLIAMNGVSEFLCKDQHNKLQINIKFTDFVKKLNNGDYNSLDDNILLFLKNNTLELVKMRFIRNKLKKNSDIISHSVHNNGESSIRLTYPFNKIEDELLTYYIEKGRIKNSSGDIEKSPQNIIFEIKPFTELQILLVKNWYDIITAILYNKTNLKEESDLDIRILDCSTL